jgi:hypothetical protein
VTNPLIRVLLELVVGAVVCGTIGRIANADNRSPILWACVTAALCVACLAIPVPILRLVVACYAAVFVLFLTNLVRLPRL